MSNTRSNENKGGAAIAPDGTPRPTMESHAVTGFVLGYTHNAEVAGDPDATPTGEMVEGAFRLIGAMARPSSSRPAPVVVALEPGRLVSITQPTTQERAVLAAMFALGRSAMRAAKVPR